MKFDITTLEGKSAGSVELSDEVFGLEPRADPHAPPAGRHTSARAV